MNTAVISFVLLFVHNAPARQQMAIRTALNSPVAITLENNKKFRAGPKLENGFCRENGGERGIRTLETVTRLHTFQACAFDHSATSPLMRHYTDMFCACKGKLGPGMFQA